MNNGNIDLGLELPGIASGSKSGVQKEFGGPYDTPESDLNQFEVTGL